MPTAIYPGTFDPVTYGHIDLAVRAAKIFTRVVAVVGENPGKKPLFSAAERARMLQHSLSSVKNLKVVRYDGLIVNCMKEFSATAIIRGLRALSDFDYEFQMAYTNRNMNDEAETVFMMPSDKFAWLNSSMVKQIARLGGDITQFVPEYVQRQLVTRLSKKNRRS